MLLWFPIPKGLLGNQPFYHKPDKNNNKNQLDAKEICLDHPQLNGTVVQYNDSVLGARYPPDVCLPSVFLHSCVCLL